MARVTEAEVQKIIDTESATDVDEFIDIANEYVTEELGETDLSDDRLKRIEQFLAAHFISVYIPRTASERAGPVSEAKQWRVGLNLQVTAYGQQAIALDSTGTLAALNSGNRRTASIEALNMHGD